ncbi:hypothetical protein NM688_g7233 [Phlebia brevispora]|uniref:Uncharacterized protein n=1 Tax=Phlebia brevispora TaxID=194682 RepID=A0ACC1S7W1_9APHY|nr:hypothetical protein NM688_g7233 [Phlebia brevispora]
MLSNRILKAPPSHAAQNMGSSSSTWRGSQPARVEPRAALHVTNAYYARGPVLNALSVLYDIQDIEPRICAMSEAEDAAGPRRSQRERKQATHFVSGGSDYHSTRRGSPPRAVESQSNKRKRSQELSDDEELSSLSELDASEPEERDADVEEDYTAPKRKHKTKQAVDKPPPKKRGPPAAKRPKTNKPGPAASSKTKKSTGAKRGRKPATGAAFDAEQVAKDTKILNDNVLFNAIMNPSAALQTTAEDFLDSLSQTPEASQAELINCILRACGCNHTLNADEVMDYDGVVDALDNITEALKQDDTPVYPLTSKLPAFKKFRKSLSEFLSRLISSAAALELLYTTDLMPTLQTWVVATSSSHLRAFRHTATVVALEVETALCEVAAEVEKQAETVSRQREGERKRKKGKGESSNPREKELEAKAAVIREHRTKLAEFLKEFVDG